MQCFNPHENFPYNLIYLKPNRNFVFVGMSGSGKSHFLITFFHNLNKVGYVHPFDRVLICYQEMQPIYERFSQIIESQGGVATFHHGIPSDLLDDVDGAVQRTAIIIDDLMLEAMNTLQCIAFSSPGVTSNSLVSF